MSSASPGAELPERLTPREAAKAIGCCPRHLLTEFIRLGWLPYPAQEDGCWSREQVQSVIARLAARRG